MIARRSRPGSAPAVGSSAACSVNRQPLISWTDSFLRAAVRPTICLTAGEHQHANRAAAGEQRRDLLALAAVVHRAGDADHAGEPGNQQIVGSGLSKQPAQACFCRGMAIYRCYPGRIHDPRTPAPAARLRHRLLRRSDADVGPRAHPPLDLPRLRLRGPRRRRRLGRSHLRDRAGVPKRAPGDPDDGAAQRVQPGLRRQPEGRLRVCHRARASTSSR